MVTAQFRCGLRGDERVVGTDVEHAVRARSGEGVVGDRARAASAERRTDRHARSRHDNALRPARWRRRSLSQGKAQLARA